MDEYAECCGEPRRGFTEYFCLWDTAPHLSDVCRGHSHLPWALTLGLISTVVSEELMWLLRKRILPDCKGILEAMGKVS